MTDNKDAPEELTTADPEVVKKYKAAGDVANSKSQKSRGSCQVTHITKLSKQDTRQMRSSQLRN